MGRVKTDKERVEKKIDKRLAKYIADNFFKVGESIEVRGLKYIATDFVPEALQVVFECVGVVQRNDTAKTEKSMD